MYAMLFAVPAATAFASEEAFKASEPSLEIAAQTSNGVTTLEASKYPSTIDTGTLNTVNGMIMLDYQMIKVPGAPDIDLMGLQYFHQMNNNLYLGMGVHAPLLQGNYGGFMVFNATLHAQGKISGNWFLNGGLSLGGGGGGSSIQQSKILSGTGGFMKAYAGLGYDFGSFAAGVNIAHVKFRNGIIDNTQLNVFIQKPVSFKLGSYSASGKPIASRLSLPEPSENTLTFEFNNIFQISPKGKNKKTIHTLSLQYSHYLKNDYYVFVAADVGYSGLPLYNQVLGGFGKKVSLLPRLNLYPQLAIGSGGYSPTDIDTNSGFLVYPKLSIEYMMTNNLGLALSAGYLIAPKGSSKNYTVGAAITYRLSSKGRKTFSGYRLNMFNESEIDVRVGNAKHNDIHMLSVKLDKMINDNWYIPIQGSVAYNAYRGFPGYGQVLAGLGYQTKYAGNKRFQPFFQIMAGADARGIILKPMVGFNYGLSDSLALYGHVGKTMSLHEAGLYPKNRRLSSYSVGLGLTYRFSMF
jgi:hypothetical protein